MLFWHLVDGYLEWSYNNTRSLAEVDSPSWFCHEPLASYDILGQRPPLSTISTRFFNNHQQYHYPWQKTSKSRSHSPATWLSVPEESRLEKSYSRQRRSNFKRELTCCLIAESLKPSGHLSYLFLLKGLPSNKSKYGKPDNQLIIIIGKRRRIHFYNRPGTYKEPSENPSLSSTNSVPPRGAQLERTGVNAFQTIYNPQHIW